MNNQNPYNNFGTGSMIAPAEPPKPPIDIPAPRERKDLTKPFLIAGLVVSIIALLVFIGLFVWAYIQFNEADTITRSRIDTAVAEAVNQNTTELEAAFTEREKEPNKTFAGPEDYSALGFLYPKTWSVYIEQDAVNGGDYRAYFRPGEVLAIRDDTPNALRLTISTQTFDSMVRMYQSYVDAGLMTMSVIQIGGNAANLYRGPLPAVGSQLTGAVCLIKLRDKTAVLQTDAAIYLKDFEALLQTVTYN